MFYQFQLFIDAFIVSSAQQVHYDRREIVWVQLRHFFSFKSVVFLNVFHDLLGNSYNDFEFGHWTTTVTELTYQFETLLVRLCVTLDLHTFKNLAFCHTRIVECEFVVDSKKESGFSAKQQQLFLKSADFALIIVSDTFNQKLLYFVFLEEYTHNEIVDVLVFDQFTNLQLSQLFQSVYLGHHCDHKLYKYTHLVHNRCEFVFGNHFDMLVKCPVYRSQESSVRMLLENIGPFEEKLQRLRILLNPNFSAVQNVYDSNQRFIIFEIHLKRIIILAFFCRFRFITLLQLILNYQTRILQIFFHCFTDGILTLSQGRQFAIIMYPLYVLQDSQVVHEPQWH